MSCTCSERKRPTAAEIPAGSNERPRQWFVLRRNYSRSAFTGYQIKWSDFSDVACRVCGAHWRTKASYVDLLETCEYWPNHSPKVEPL